MRSWPVDVAGEPGRMSRGFHAFFRQYYNLRAVLRRTDPTLERLAPARRLPPVRAGGGADSFARIPRTPPLNLAAFVARSPSFDLAGLAAVDVEAALGLLDVDFPATYTALDGVSAADVLDRLRFPGAARHLALEVFARSFFADPREFSGGELVAMFHLYFVGSAEGLLFDVPRDDYDATLWAPLGRHLATGWGSMCAPAARSLPSRTADDASPCCTARGGRALARADAVVLAPDPVGLRQRLVADPPGSSDAVWRGAIAVAGIRSRLRRVAALARSACGTEPARRSSARAATGRSTTCRCSTRFEDHAARWARRAPAARSSSCTRTPCPRTPTRVTCAPMRSELDRLYPETTGSTVVHEEWLLDRDCVLVGLDPWRSRPGVRTPDPRVVLAGDAVRCDLPVALMERAATTGWMAADRLLARLGPAGPLGVGSVPRWGLLAAAVTRLRGAGIRSLPLRRSRRGAQLVEALRVDQVVGPELARRRAHPPAMSGARPGRRGTRTGRRSRWSPRSSRCGRRVRRGR